MGNLFVKAATTDVTIIWGDTKTIGWMMIMTAYNIVVGIFHLAWIMFHEI